MEMKALGFLVAWAGMAWLAYWLVRDVKETKSLIDWFCCSHKKGNDWCESCDYFRRSWQDRIERGNIALVVLAGIFFLSTLLTYQVLDTGTFSILWKVVTTLSMSIILIWVNFRWWRAWSLQEISAFRFKAKALIFNLVWIPTWITLFVAFFFPGGQPLVM